MNKITLKRNLCKLASKSKLHPSEAQNLLISCLQTLSETEFGQQRLDKWVVRNNAKKIMQNIGEGTPKCKRILKRLLALVISSLDVCTWQDNFEVGALPLDRESQPLSTEEKAAKKAQRMEQSALRKERQQTERERRFSYENVG